MQAVPQDAVLGSAIGAVAGLAGLYIGFLIHAAAGCNECGDRVAVDPLWWCVRRIVELVGLVFAIPVRILRRAAEAVRR